MAKGQHAHSIGMLHNLLMTSGRSKEIEADPVLSKMKMYVVMPPEGVDHPLVSYSADHSHIAALAVHLTRKLCWHQ